MPLTAVQVPYTGPYGLPGGSAKSKGPTAEALKRGLSRMGAPSLPWRDFDQHYNANLEAAFDWFDPGGKNGYGDGRWKKMRAAIIPPGMAHAGEYALDRYSRTLIQDEAGVMASSSAEARVQKFIAEFWEIAIAHAGIWHYSKARPGKVIVDPAAGGYSDCSLMVIQAHHYAKRKASVNVPDPSKMGYSGYGNCMTPETKILTSDLRWVPAGDLKVGDELWTLDEEAQHTQRPTAFGVGGNGGSGRRYRRGIVTSSTLARKQCYRVCIETGESFICTVDHPWLSKSSAAGSRWNWCETRNLMAVRFDHERLLCRPFTPWSHVETWEAGWLAGMFDGEGWVRHRGARGDRAALVGVTQVRGETSARLVATAQKYGDFAVIDRDPEDRGVPGRRQIEMWTNGSGYVGAMSFLGKVRPERLISAFDIEGQVLRARPDHLVAVEAIESVGTQEIQSLSTNTGTYFAEGFAVHNTDLYEDDWPKVGAPYRVGDLAHFHSERHIIECIAPGDVKTAKWGSNGREAAPELINSLHGYSRFPGEFLYVVRPTLVA